MEDADPPDRHIRGDQAVNNNEQAVILSLNNGNPWLWAQDYTDVEGQPADINAGLTSLGFIRAAIRRSKWFWGAMAVIGLLIGSGLYVALPPAYQASTELFLKVGPESAPGTAILNDQAIAQTRTVAGLALHKLGLRQSVSSFASSYTATVVSDQVLVITVNAPSSGDAVKRASALATAFLQYRANQLEAQQKRVSGLLDQQISQAKQHISFISKQISQAVAQPKSSANRAKLSSLRTELSRATSDLTMLEQTVSSGKASTQAGTAQQVGGSDVLDPAAPVPPHSRLKHLLLYGVIGLLAGLALALSIVVVRALISERLYRRDDVARAVGAPVKLSVGTVRLSRWLPGRRGLAAARLTNVRRIVAYLRGAVPARSRGAALAVVPVDDPRAAALTLVSLAVSCAQEGKQVVVADLASGIPAAGLLGTKEPGVHSVRVHDAHLVVAVPERDDVVPVGPLGRTSPQAQHSPFSEAVRAAHASSDILLTLAPLDPSFGGEHLATWAPDAVVVVTAGRSSWTKVHAVGEMIRLAHTRLVSAVLVGADKTDESLGATRAPGAGREAEIGEESVHADAEGSLSQSRRK